MTMNPKRPGDPLADRLAAAEQRIEELEGQIEVERSSSRSMRQQLVTKQREVLEIHRSRAWGLLAALRSLKHRFADPLLGLAGIVWPRRRAPERPMNLHQPPCAPSRANAYDVVCFSTCEWDSHFQRPQQLMSLFALAGHRVFYISQQFRSDGPAWAVTLKRDNVYEVTFRGNLLDVYANRLGDRDRDLLFEGLDALRRDVALSATAMVVQLPFWWPLARQASQRFGWPVIYDCLDFHAGFSTVRQAMVSCENELLSEADAVVVSSTVLAQRALRVRDEVVLLRNACDFEHFARPPRTDLAWPIEMLSTKGRPVIGYYGAISDWFDATLVADLAKRRPDWNFVLIGSTYGAAISHLARLTNVSLPGEAAYEALPEWLGRFDVAMIPFKRTSLTEATNPVKVYEMLAGGKAIVSVPIPEVKALAPLVRLASNAKEFEREIAAALTEDSGAADERRAFARKNTWAQRFEVLQSATAAAFRSVSIIIVTHNERESTRLCLETLSERTDWPNYEVLVIDNASTDGTAQFLHAAEASYPSLRVIYNEHNAGVAGANNTALSLAVGDAIVLLSSRAVLSRGWLSALIRHLQARPSIGLIGPATNETESEARADVGYDDLNDMPSWALDYVRLHDSEVFPVRIISTLCVAMRRSTYEEIGMFGGDTARRLRDAGYEIVCARDAFVHCALARTV